MNITETNFHFDTKKMECFLRFRFSQNIDFYSTVIPLSLCLVVSIFTLIKCYLLFKKYPEDLTRSLLDEIKFYPLVFLLCNSTSVIQNTLQFQNIGIHPVFFVIDQFFKGIQGSLICIIFFWKKLHVKWLGFSDIISGEQFFSTLTAKDLEHVERVE